MTVIDSMTEKLARVAFAHMPSSQINVCKCGERYFTHGNVMHEPSHEEWDEVITYHIAEKQFEMLNEMSGNGENDE